MRWSFGDLASSLSKQAGVVIIREKKIYIYICHTAEGTFPIHGLGAARPGRTWMQITRSPGRIAQVLGRIMVEHGFDSFSCAGG